MEYLENQIAEIRNLQQQLDSQEWRQQIKDAVELTLDTLRNNKKILLAGNGGSAADAQHMAGEFVSRFEFDRPGLPAIALTVDTSILTACANDYGYENVFSRQVQAIGQSGDVLWAYTTSGKSANIIKAAQHAKDKGMKVIIFCGENVTALKAVSDLLIPIKSKHTPRVQEWHLISGHLICGSVEAALFS